MDTVSTGTTIEVPRDKRAAALLKQLRIDHGLSPEGLSFALLQARLGHVSGRNIRRIEGVGAIPTPRVQFALARFFDRSPSEIWVLRSRVAA